MNRRTFFKFALTAPIALPAVAKAAVQPDGWLGDYRYVGKLKFSRITGYGRYAEWTGKGFPPRAGFDARWVECVNTANPELGQLVRYFDSVGDWRDEEERCPEYVDGSGAVVCR